MPLGKRLWGYFEKVGDVFIAIFLLVVAFAFVVVDEWSLRWKIIVAAPLITLAAGMVLLLYALFVEVILQSVIAAMVMVWHGLLILFYTIKNRIRAPKDDKKSKKS